MSKIGKRLIDAASEADSIARGERKAARLHDEMIHIKVLLAFEAWNAGKTLQKSMSEVGLPLTRWREVTKLYKPPDLIKCHETSEKNESQRKNAIQSQKRFHVRMAAIEYARHAAKIGGHPEIIDQYDTTFVSTPMDIYFEDVVAYDMTGY